MFGGNEGSTIIARSLLPATKAIKKPALDSENL